MLVLILRVEISILQVKGMETVDCRAVRRLRVKWTNHFYRSELQADFLYFSGRVGNIIIIILQKPNKWKTVHLINNISTSKKNEAKTNTTTTICFHKALFFYINKNVDDLL